LYIFWTAAPRHSWFAALTSATAVVERKGKGRVSERGKEEKDHRFVLRAGGRRRRRYFPIVTQARQTGHKLISSLTHAELKNLWQRPRLDQRHYFSTSVSLCHSSRLLWVYTQYFNIILCTPTVERCYVLPLQGYDRYLLLLLKLYAVIGNSLVVTRWEEGLFWGRNRTWYLPSVIVRHFTSITCSQLLWLKVIDLCRWPVLWGLFFL